MQNNPKKKSERELIRLLSEKIRQGDYVFLKHAKQRLKDRGITDLEVLNILERKPGSRTKRNKRKDKYEKGHQDWNYCIEGINHDDIKIRIIFSFNENLMPIITVIRLSHGD